MHGCKKIDRACGCERCAQRTATISDVNRSDNDSEAPAPQRPASRAQCLDHAVIDDLIELDSVEPGFLHTLLTSFLERAPCMLMEIADAALHHDAERLKRLTHEFRGSAGSMGARDLAAALLSLELQVLELPGCDHGLLVKRIEREFEYADEELRIVLRRPGLESPRTPFIS